MPASFLVDNIWATTDLWCKLSNSRVAAFGYVIPIFNDSEKSTS
jgi:hypothetical protein